MRKRITQTEVCHTPNYSLKAKLASLPTQKCQIESCYTAIGQFGLVVTNHRMCKMAYELLH
ncbi:hypothetical protein, partial [Vibrio parahaemolyticus]|uniref:hypothetical protein n=1 Tax=Vibrio parahaemolyticus TaxID=670 RepID=UPI001C610B7D